MAGDQTKASSLLGKQLNYTSRPPKVHFDKTLQLARGWIKSRNFPTQLAERRIKTKVFSEEAPTRGPQERETRLRSHYTAVSSKPSS